MEDFTSLDAVVAAAALVGRAGGAQFEVGFAGDENGSSAKARWYAQAMFKGARLICDEQPSPEAAADGLAHRLLRGAQCTGCAKAVGSGGCRWRRDGTEWVRGCDGKRTLTRKGGPDGHHTG